MLPGFIIESLHLTRLENNNEPLIFSLELYKSKKIPSREKELLEILIFKYELEEKSHFYKI